MLSSLSSRAPDGEQDECREIQAEVGRQMDVQVTGLDQDVARGGGPIAQEIEDKIEEQAESAEEDIEEAMKGYEEAIRIVKDKARRAIKEGSEEDVIKETQENIQMIEDEFMMQARAKIKESKPKEKPGEKEADVPEQAFPASRTLPNQNMGEVGETCAGLDYEMHYETSQHSVKDVVREILQDIATNKNLHDWDDKLVITPFKKLETVIRRYLATCSQEMLNDLLIHSSVDEVRSENGQLQNTPALLEEGQATGQFFFPKVSPIMSINNQQAHQALIKC